MNSELPVSADALLAERARLEEELQASEDWCELLRLKSRKDRGEGMSAVNAARLEMVLIDALAEDPNFVRYKAVCVALERLIRGLPPLPPARPKTQAKVDDLTEIRGITASMARRLNALDVTSFMQIAEWSAADIKSISADLGIGRQIYEQDWVEQAEVLATNPDTPDVAAPLAAKTPTVQQPPFKTVVPPVVAKQPIRETPVASAMARDNSVEPNEQKPAIVPVRPEPVPKQAEARPQSQPDVTAKQPSPEHQKPVAAAEPVEPIRGPAASKPVAVEAQLRGVPEQSPSLSPAVTQKAKAEPTAEALASAPPVSVDPAKPFPVPPIPLRADKYGTAPDSLLSIGVTSEDGGVTKEYPIQKPAPSPVSTASALPMPPPPLRVQVPLGGAESPMGSSDPSEVADALLRAPPRPFVVTRESLPPKSLETPVDAQSPAPSSAAAGPQSGSARQPPVATPPTPVPNAIVGRAKPAEAATANPASTASLNPASPPAMSIAEAIAYAAEVARQGPGATANATPVAPPADREKRVAPSAVTKPDVSPAQRAGSLAPARATAAPVPAPKETASKAPVVPPPLPAGFTPPEPELDVSPQPRVRSTTVQNGRAVERDDLAGYRISAEEATVEIIVKSPPNQEPPRVALAKVSAEATSATARPATPIGRFLKALTGN